MLFRSQHSQSLEVMFAHVPGLKVVAPSTPYDAKGMLKAAIRDDNPVMFIENITLYNTRGEVPEGDYLVPLDKADIKRPGKDITLIGHSKGAVLAMQAAELLAAQGIDAEVLDLRSLRPLDRLPAQTIFTFVDLGPRLITLTHHNAIAGPYHRNGDAILDVHHAFERSPDEARRIMKAHGATLDRKSTRLNSSHRT